MPKNPRVLFIGIALLLAVITVWLTQQWLNQAVEQAASASTTPGEATSVRVLVASESLPSGTILQGKHLAWQPWPAEAQLDGYFTALRSTPEQLVGAVVRNGVARGEPLAVDGIVQPGGRSFLAAVLRPGYRAVSIAVSASTGVSGFIRPGDRVDVILSRIVGSGNTTRVVTNTILTDLRVVGIDQRVTSEDGAVTVPQTATLEVTSEQAEAIAAATELGKLSLALRSLARTDDDTADASGVTRFWLQQEPRGARDPRERVQAVVPAGVNTRSSQTVQVIRGNSADGVGEGQ